MRAGAIESIALPAQPARRAGPADRGDGRRWSRGRSTTSARWCAGRRRSPRCPSRRCDAVLDMLAGRYPSDDFAELRPRLVWDRVTGTLTARRRRPAAGGHQRRHDPRPRAVRRLPGRRRGRRRPAGRRARRGDGLRVAGRRRVPARLVVLADRGHHPRPGAGHPRAGPARRDAVLEGRRPRPAAGAGPGARRVPARGRLGRHRRPAWRGPRAAGLDELGARTTCSPTSPSSARPPATCPTTARCVVERFRDELGDWRLVVHSPFGAQVNAPWALALAARLRERYGMDVAVDALRRRHRAAAARHHRRAARGADLAVFDPDESSAMVTAEVGGSALFAARFRECAARALLLPRRDPRRRTPLWQQRQRAAQLLAVASEFAVVPDRARGGARVPAGRLRRAGPGRADARRRAPGAVRVVEVETQTAVAVRPVAAVRLRRRSSSTRATRRWPSGGPQALALDTGAAGRAARPRRAARAARRRGARRGRARAAAAARRAARRATSTARPTCCACVGDLTAAEAAARGATPAWLEELGPPGARPGAHRRRSERWRRDRGRRPAARRSRHGAAGRRARGVHRAGRRPARRSGRPLRPHPRAVPAAEVAARLGLGVAVVDRDAAAAGRHRAAGRRRVPARRHRPRVVRRRGAPRDPPPHRWPRCARRSSRCRSATLARFLPVLAVGRAAGCAAPTACSPSSSSWPGRWCLPRALESLVLPARVRDYSPAMLDELDQRRRGALGRRRRAARRRRLGHASRRPTRAAAAARAAGEPRARLGAARVLEPLGRRAGAVLPRRCPTSSAPTDDDRAGRRRLGPRLGRAGSPTTPSPRCGPGWPAAARTQPAARRPGDRARATAGRGRAGRRCPPAPARRRSPAAGRRLPEREPDRPGAPRPRRGAARAARRGHPRGGAGRAGRRRVRRGLPGPGGVRGDRAGPARLLRRDARRGPVRASPGAVDRLRSFAAAGPACRRRRGAGRDRPRQPLRRRAALAGAAVPRRGRRLGEGTGRRPGTGRGARRARSSCWSTASWCSTSSAAARRCCRGPRTSRCSRRPRPRCPVRWPPGRWAGWSCSGPTALGARVDAVVGRAAGGRFRGHAPGAAPACLTPREHRAPRRWDAGHGRQVEGRGQRPARN